MYVMLNMIKDMSKYELERDEAEKELNRIDEKLKKQYQKLEDLEHKIFCCRFNYYFCESLKSY